MRIIPGDILMLVSRGSIVTSIFMRIINRIEIRSRGMGMGARDKNVENGRLMVVMKGRMPFPHTDYSKFIFVLLYSIRFSYLNDLFRVINASQFECLWFASVDASGFPYYCMSSIVHAKTCTTVLESE